MPDDRTYDIALFGATGFTGALTAEYLARNAPKTSRWALVGRNRSKLEALRDRLAEIEPAHAEIGLLEADVSDSRSMDAVAAASRVVITTVGPYIRYGEPLVAACANAGTDYVDLTGEPEFIDRTYVRHHGTATDTGARIVHACGFDSIPHDLGALYTVHQLPDDVPLRVRGFVQAGGQPSGGTFHSAITAFSRAPQTAKAMMERRKIEPKPEGRKVTLEKASPRRESAVDAWALPLPTIDPMVVARSAAAREDYGPDFTYSHFAAIKRLPIAVGAVGGVGAIFALSQLRPTRSLLLKALSPGDGPSPEQREKSWFTVTFVGEGGGRRVVTEVGGGDPGYGETSKMLAESALCLAHDDLPETAGQVTTAAAMGDALTDRLERAGITFRVREEGPA